MVMPTVKKPKPGKGSKGFSISRLVSQNLPLLLLAACLVAAGFLIKGSPSTHGWLKGGSIASWASTALSNNMKGGPGDTSTPATEAVTAPPQRSLLQDTQDTSEIEYVELAEEEARRQHERITQIASKPDEIVEAEAAACRITGKVADCGCDFASVERLNRLYVHPVMQTLTQQPFFRFFKVNLYCDCQFWPDAGMCFQKDCCVAECDKESIPDAWRKYDEQVMKLKQAKAAACQGEAGVDRSVDEGVEDALSAATNWHLLNNPWVPEDDQGLDYIYVDLQRNVEKYTGYKGEDARRIWAAMYEQDAIREAAAADSSSGVEQRVLYRLISGMHASITMSIITNFYNETSGTWGPNLPFFKARFTSPAARPYVENLYFAFLFVLRAVTKAGPALQQLDYHTGWNKEEGDLTKLLATQMVSSPKMKGACPIPFDEGLLWRHDPERSEQLRKQLMVTFHNITRLMDCVGCEKCKMHGKLNMLGIATALKVLFSQPRGPAHTGSLDQALQLSAGSQEPLHLDRNEAIALINFFGKLSDSVEAIRALSLKVQAAEEAAAQAAGTTAQS